VELAKVLDDSGLRAEVPGLLQYLARYQGETNHLPRVKPPLSSIHTRRRDSASPRSRGFSVLQLICE
jgi:hypothetical protein